MKTLSCVLLLAVGAFAQSVSTPCGTASNSAAEAVSSGRTQPVAAKAQASPAGQSAQHTTNVALQIQLNRTTPGLPSPSCRCGTVDARSLSAKANSQEIPILTGLAGGYRFDHILVRETAKFTSSSVTKLSVGVGRANLGADVISPFPLMSAYAPNNYWSDRPVPPQLSGAYDLVLYFEATSALGDGTASNLGAGTVAWEICGYNVRPSQ